MTHLPLQPQERWATAAAQARVVRIGMREASEALEQEADGGLACRLVGLPEQSQYTAATRNSASNTQRNKNNKNNTLNLDQWQNSHKYANN